MGRVPRILNPMRSSLARAAYAIARVFGAEPIVERASASSYGSRVIPDQALWFQFQRVGGGMTPQRLSQILRTADTGDLTQYVDLLMDARQKDGHLQGILSQVEESIAELDWTLSLPEGARAKDKRAMAFADEALRAATGSSNDDSKGFGDMIAHLAGSFYIGHNVAETLWQKNPKGYLVPRGWELHNARRFGYRQSNGAFVWRDSGTPFEGIRIQEEYPNRFVVSQPRVNGDVPSHEGLGRVLMWAALFRNWSMSDWLRTAELAWKPWRIGYYTKAASDKDIAGLETVLQNLVTSGTAVLADTTKFDASFAQQSGGGSKPTHAELYNVVAQEMSKAALGATETVQASSSSGYAQAQVHKGVSKTILRARARHIAAVIMRDVVRPLIQMNFGKDVLIPTFAFVLPDPVEIAAFGQGIKALAEAGLVMPQAWVRSRIGCPDPKPDEEVLSPPKTAPATPTPPPTDTPTASPGDAQTDPSAADTATPAGADQAPPADA